MTIMKMEYTERDSEGGQVYILVVIHQIVIDTIKEEPVAWVGRCGSVPITRKATRQEILYTL